MYDIYIYIYTHIYIIGTRAFLATVTHAFPFISYRRSEIVGLAASSRLIFADALPLSLGWQRVKSVAEEASPGAG